jgi:hypothetical protein
MSFQINIYFDPQLSFGLLQYSMFEIAHFLHLIVNFT